MPFTDSVFLLIFLPTVLVLYFIAESFCGQATKARRAPSVANAVIAISSIVFLGIFDHLYATILSASTIILIGIAWVVNRTYLLENSHSRSKISALPELGFAATLTGLVLLYSAYRLAIPIFVSQNTWATALPDYHFSVPSLFLPLGLSVFVCHAVSLIVDVYRKRGATPLKPAHLAMYVLGFPFLIAGPIIRYRDISQQLNTRQLSMASFAYGVRRFSIGLCKVALIAQTLAAPADIAFSNIDSLGFIAAWLGLLCFSLQIYFDLSGYADMALGIGRMLGFRLPENFNSPYAADSLHEFWRRWNISLTNWCRTYLGLSLKDTSKTAASSPTTVSAILLFVVISLWHGPSWTVFIWGAIHAVFVVLERTSWGIILSRWPTPLRHVYLLVLTNAAWVFFRADSLTDAIGFFQALGGFGDPGLDTVPLPIFASTWAALIVGMLSTVPILPTIGRWSVTVDALATALQMIVTTAATFVWVRVLRQKQKNLSQD